MVAAPPGHPQKVTAPGPPDGTMVHTSASTSAMRQSPIQSLQSSTAEARARSPVTAGLLRTSASGCVRGSNSSNSASNVPDVTADIYDPAGNQHQEESPDIPGPDYPLDSLPRHASIPSLGAQLAHRGVPETSTAGPRQSQSFSGGLQTQNIGRVSAGASRASDSLPVVSVPRYLPASIPASSIQTSSVAPRSTAIMTSHIFSVPMVTTTSTTSQAQVSHSNVVVSVNHSLLSSSDPRQIHTQNLNVGVVSRLDTSRHPPNVLPDLLAHSQPSAAGRVSQSQPRPAVPITDRRVSSSQRQVVDQVTRQSRAHRDQRHSRSRRHSHRQSSTSEDEPCKESCYKCLAVGMSFRWILVVLSLLGVCCVVTGIVLAALHAAGNSFLFLAIMFIGLGVLLVVVVGVGWKCTPRGHEPLHALFHLGEFRTRRSGRRRRTHRHRDGRWYGGAMYPEFQYRRPPPSYNASMQEYQQQTQLAAQQPQQTPDLYDPNNLPDEDYSLPSSPPPSYRSRASTVRAGIQITFPPNQGGDYPDSRPPTYRSHAGPGRTRPSLNRDEDDYDDDDDDHVPAPADVAFTGSAVIVDTSTNQNGTSIQIDPSMVSNQNVTVSVTTVSVTTQPVQSDSSVHGQGAAGGSLGEEDIDPVGTDFDGDKIQTAL